VVETNGDGRLLARLDERSADHERRLGDLDGDIVTLNKRINDLELIQQRIIIGFAILFAVLQFIGPSVLNLVVHLPSAAHP